MGDKTKGEEVDNMKEDNGEEEEVTTGSKEIDWGEPVGKEVW